MNKAELRAKMRRYRPKPGETWLNGLLHWSVLQRAKVIFCFLPLEDEPNTFPLIQQLLKQKKQVCIPRCVDTLGHMEAVLYNGEVAFDDAAGVPTSTGQVINPQSIDLILVPGLAFDAKGNRLGRGKGYYDRFLGNNYSGVTCGICPAMRFLSSLPIESHDRTVDYVYTPYGLYKTKDK